MKMFSPNVVVAISLNRTLVKVGVAEQVGVGGVGREKVLVAVAHGPLAEPREQLDGSFAWHEGVSNDECFVSNTLTYRCSTPRGGHHRFPSVVCRQECSVRPCEVSGGKWAAV